MSFFYKELSTEIMASEEFNSNCGDLFKAYISKMVGQDFEVNDSAVKKLATSIQYFYRSGFDKYRNEGAILLSMLLDVDGHKTKELVAIADTVFSQTGDFPNVKLLKDRFPDVIFKVSFFEEALKELREQLNTVDEINHPLTNYQRSLWEDLTSDLDIITSAPTSTGKTHIILRYLVQEIMEGEGGFAVIVVPTRALISELAGKIYEIAKIKSYERDIEICTIPREGIFKDKTFFVMTQERLSEVLMRGDVYFNYLFIDEAHNISDDSRGVLLHSTLQKLLDGSKPQIIISMPSPRYTNAFDSVFEDIEFSSNSTKLSPVAKILMPVKFKQSQLQITRLNKEYVVSVDKGFNGTKSANIVYRLGQGESNIIYKNRPDYCENTAGEIAGLVTKNKASLALDEAADYIEEFLHHDFTLADNLRKGVAFHYGPLPGVVRTMIEDLACRKELDFIVCTSTLAEGVNLPAKNLFLDNPTQQTPKYQPNARLEDVKLSNVTGRAGRMLEHFAGNIFLIKHEDWTFQDYFDETEEEVDKIPTYFKVLNEDLHGVLDALLGIDGLQADNHYLYNTIANKLLKEYDGETLNKTLGAKELTLDGEEREQLQAHVKKAYDDLKVDTFTLEANPTVGYIQQNNLYEFLSDQEALSEWVLPHPMAPSLYPRLKKICEELSRTGVFNLKKASSVGYACKIARKWMQGDSLKTIIVEQLKDDEDYGKTYNCNRSVRDVITVIDNDVRFRMSSALRCYHSLLTDILGARKEDLQSVKIHSFIEIGGWQDRFVDLVNFGLSRETSLEIDRILPHDIEFKSVGDLRKLYNENSLDALHVITLREIDALLV